MRKLIPLLLALLLATPALADGTLDGILSHADKQRLLQFESTMADALRQARAGGDAADVALLDRLLTSKPLPFDEAFDPTGPWRCRTIKLGGLLPLIVYPPFKCRIDDDGAGWFLKKLSGSQRTQGRFYTEGPARLIYVGAGHVAGEPPRRYGDDPKEDQVARAERRGKERMLLMFPEPQYESKLDILVLER